MARTTVEDALLTFRTTLDEAYALCNVGIRGEPLCKLLERSQCALEVVSDACGAISDSVQVQALLDQMKEEIRRLRQITSHASD